MRESEEYEVGQQKGARLEPSTTPADIPLTIARAPEGRLSALQQHHFFCY
ncbi:unnamed protein product [Ectocarpus sp. CCAP 1310/34]|nr:unnamed protein product [Ectocarpus sp. CCAP 1310/34]